MKIALIAPPFIPVPPRTYGGTELFVHELARGLARRGHRVILYANGESVAPCELRWVFRDMDWPQSDPGLASLKTLEHTAFAVEDALREGVDVIHGNDAMAVPFSRLSDVPFVHTLHHPHEPALSTLYERHPGVRYVAISRFQRARERLPGCAIIHHGLDLSEYPWTAKKERYACFLGRIAPIKGTHLAVQAAARARVPLKIAGEIQPIFRGYWESEVRPFVDGKSIEYVGEATAPVKKALLAGASALLFPIQWNEPFGLVMIEAMACGTPVLAFPGGSVPEVVKHGVSGWICTGLDDLAARLAEPGISAEACRAHVESLFTTDRMTEEYEAVYRAADIAPHAAPPPAATAHHGAHSR
ncbi:MAG: glycosyltransferase family 4 protein [Polyangiaceae bacterium]